MIYEIEQRIVSIHALLAERDQPFRFPTFSSPRFNSRAPRGARLLHLLQIAELVVVSIHALLAERDFEDTLVYDLGVLFQFTRSSRSATLIDRYAIAEMQFQFTRSSRSATRTPIKADFTKSFQFTRSSRSATIPAHATTIAPPVSIHALLAERDQRDARILFIVDRFQFTRSSRSAT